MNRNTHFRVDQHAARQVTTKQTERQRFVSHTISVHFVEKKSFHMFTEENMFIVKTK